MCYLILLCPAAIDISCRNEMHTIVADTSTVSIRTSNNMAVNAAHMPLPNDWRPSDVAYTNASAYT